MPGDRGRVGARRSSFATRVQPEIGFRDSSKVRELCETGWLRLEVVADTGDVIHSTLVKDEHLAAEIAVAVERAVRHETEIMLWRRAEGTR